MYNRYRRCWNTKLEDGIGGWSAGSRLSKCWRCQDKTEKQDDGCASHSRFPLRRWNCLGAKLVPGSGLKQSMDSGAAAGTAPITLAIPVACRQTPDSAACRLPVYVMSMSKFWLDGPRDPM